MKRKELIIVTFCIVILFAFGLYIYEFEHKSFSDVIFASASLLGVYGLLYNFKREREIAEATFIFDLYKAFRSNEKIVNLYSKLEQHYLGKEVEINENDRKGIVEYLVFMENLASLFQRNIVTIKKIDPVFGFDFFIVTNNPVVQEVELIPYCDYYIGTYKLYNAWFKYRNKKEYPVPLDVNALCDKSPKFEDIIKLR